MGKHALLSASSAHRWMVCTRAPRLEEFAEEKTSIYANEGTLAHSLAELKLKLELGMISEQEYLKKLKIIKANPLYLKEMDEATDIHKDFCIERFNEAKAVTKDAVIMLEQRLDYSPWVPQGFGTSDVVIITDKVLEVIDYKHGIGVPVSAHENMQMKLYGLGAINQFGFLYDLETIHMTICQPRLDNISTFEMSVRDLINWGEEVVKPKAEMAFQGDGDFVPGEHCRFCKVKATCRARADENMKLACLDFQEPPLLSDEEVVELLFAIDDLISWATDVQEYALNQALHENKQWPGMKLVEGRGTRKYVDEEQVVKVLSDAGYEQDVIYKKTLNTITALEKELGRKTFNELLGSLITKSPGRLRLVPEDDKRPEIKASPEADFK